MAFPPAFGEVGKEHSMVPLPPLLSKPGGLFGCNSALGAGSSGMEWGGGGGNAKGRGDSSAFIPSSTITAQMSYVSA